MVTYRRRSVRALVELHVHGTAGRDAGQRLQRAAGHAFVAHARSSGAVPSGFAPAESSAAPAHADTGPSAGPGAGGPDLDSYVHVDLNVHVDGCRQHPQTDTQQADDRAEHVLADRAALPAAGRAAGPRVHRPAPSTATTALGADAVDGPAQRFHCPDFRRPGSVHAI